MPTGGIYSVAQERITSQISASEIDVLDGVTAGTVTASKAIVVDASKDITTFNSVDVTTVTNASLVLESLNPMTIKLNDTDGLQLDNAAIASFAAATDTAGNDVYIETEDAGGTPTTAKTGGLLSIKCGDGAVTATTVVGGIGGALTLAAGDGGGQSGTVAGGAGAVATFKSGAGGAQTGAGATGAGGAGGALAITGQNGGATDNTGSDNAGAGGAVTITAGTGGAASAGTGDGGAGGDLTLTAGTGGATTGGAAGAPGDVIIGSGVLRMGVQTIDMADAAVTTTLVPGTPTGTLLTGNILYVDANSGTTENLLLPPEADCTGLFLVIENTGGETINVQNDAGGAVVTLETANVAYCVCDGTSWTGSVGVP